MLIKHAMLSYAIDIPHDDACYTLPNTGADIQKHSTLALKKGLIAEVQYSVGVGVHLVYVHFGDLEDTAGCMYQV